MAAELPGADVLTVRVAQAGPIADGIHAFELRHPDGNDLPEFTPGAHLSVRTPGGFVRKYSLSNDPAERDRYVIAVKRDKAGQGGSVDLIDRTRPGDELTVSVPRNDFALAPRATSFIFIAGGIGITPIMSMVRHLKSTGRGRFKLYYLTRSPQETAFRDELTAPQMRGQVVLHHDHGDPARSFDVWPVVERPKGEHIYCCGPRPLMQSVRDMTGHWSSAAVHFEDFDGDKVKSQPEDKAFKVRLARSGGVLDVPAGTSILEALRAAGHEAPSSCESGTCGTCRTRLLAGEPEHRDLVLADDEKGGNIMICVSRAHSPELTIDR
jgi:phthalate 4,5-dioxygenase reductase component